MPTPTLALQPPCSYCVECDALPGECEHSGARYLEPIAYERVEGLGWRVPDAERALWETLQKHRENRLGHYAPGTQKRRPEQETRPIQQLVVELEAWIDLGPRLEEALRLTYEREPLRVTRLVINVLDGAQTGRLYNPAGLLATRLRDL